MKTQIRLRPYRAGDIDAFTPRPDMAQEGEAMGFDWAKGPPAGRTWTLVDRDETVLGVGGVHVRPGDRPQAWACLGELPRRAWPQVLWLAERALTYVLRQHELIETACRAEFPQAALALGRLNFQPGFTGEDPRLPGVPLTFMHRKATVCGATAGHAPGYLSAREAR